MRINLVLAWLLILGTFGTAALLRQFHHETPTSPFFSPINGSALFAAIFLLMLVTAWERRRGMEKYIETCRRHEQREQDVREQKQMDEAAGRILARRS